MATRVMVVDANREFAILIRQALEDSERFSVWTAHSAQDALRLAGEQEFDLCVLDFGLPDSSPHDFLAELRARFPEIVVVAIPIPSAIDEDELQTLNVNAVLEKPFYLPQLASILSDAMNRSPYFSRLSRSVLKKPVMLGDKHRIPTEPKEPELPDWLGDVDATRDALSSVLGHGDVESCLLVKDRYPLAYVGNLRRSQARDLAQIIASRFSEEPSGSVARYLEPSASGEPRLLFAQTLGQRAILALVLTSPSSLVSARHQAATVAQALLGRAPEDLGDALQELDTYQPAEGVQPRTDRSAIDTHPNLLADQDEPQLEERTQTPRPEPEQSWHAHELEQFRQATEPAPESEWPANEPEFSEPAPVTPNRAPTPSRLEMPAHQQPSEQQPEQEPAGEPEPFDEPVTPIAPEPPAQPPAREPARVQWERFEDVPDEPAGRYREEQPADYPPTIGQDEMDVSVLAEDLPDDWVPRVESDLAANPLIMALIELSEGDVTSRDSGNGSPAEEQVPELPPDWLPRKLKGNTLISVFEGPYAGGDPPPQRPGRLIYHFVLVPRFPAHRLAGPLAQPLIEWVQEICLAWDWGYESTKVDPRYLMISISLPEDEAPADAAATLREELSRRLLERFEPLRASLRAGHFWARRHLTSSGNPPNTLQVQSFLLRARRTNLAS